MQKKVLINLLFVSSMYADMQFEEIVSKVMGNYPGVAASNEAIKEADASLDTAMWQYFPTPSIDMSKNSNSDQATARLSQPLWTGGKLDAAYDQATAAKAEAVYALDEKKYKLIETVLEHCQNYIQSKYSKEALYEGIKRLDSLSEMIDRRISSGISSESDKKLLQSRITQIKSDLLSAQQKEQVALKQLSILLVDDINGINFIDKIPLDSLNAQDLVSKISISHPNLLKAEEQVKSASYEVDKQRASLSPSLSANAEHRRGDIYDETNDSKDNIFYFKLESSFGAGLSVLSNIEQAKIKLQKLKFEKSSMESELIDAFWVDYNNMLVSKNKIDNLELNKNLSHDIFDSNKRLFLADKKQWLDLVNSSRELMDIEVSLANTKVTYFISKYKIALMSGLINPENGEYKKGGKS